MSGMGSFAELTATVEFGQRSKHVPKRVQPHIERTRSNIIIPLSAINPPDTARPMPMNVRTTQSTSTVAATPPVCRVGR